jgi:chromosome partitioning protein
MRFIVVFSNQKGGVGKTTTTRELGIYIAATGRRLLFIDCDPQGNLTKSFLEEEPQNGLYEALTGVQVNIVELSETSGLLAGSYRLALLERSLIGEIDAHTRLKALLSSPLFADYELIFLDTPPSLGVLTINALTAADCLVVPMAPALYSMQGTNDLFNTVAKVRSNLNPALSLTGVIINAFDAVPVITRQIRSEIEESFGEKVFKTVLSRSIKIEESIANRLGVIYHQKPDKSRVKEEVAALGEELLTRLKGALSPST